ncbi:uncharacterized protein LOC119445496 isoform X2 [Dermacentor silvarum]|uniref:uncharacterized protein LOC119445496 isoform X2 n=1 Tax=Dermacentor silvarum TaxID=543639 RepID=UPI002101C094|nr:uncharacterized protein LOC119445496 isoform X2 [Dermacentor silvarum]
MKREKKIRGCNKRLCTAKCLVLIKLEQPDTVPPWRPPAVVHDGAADALRADRPGALQELLAQAAANVTGSSMPPAGLQAKTAHKSSIVYGHIWKLQRILSTQATLQLSCQVDTSGGEIANLFSSGKPDSFRSCHRTTISLLLDMFGKTK